MQMKPLILLLPILLAACETTHLTTTSKADIQVANNQTAVAKAQDQEVSTKTNLEKDNQSSNAFTVVGPPPKSEACAVFKPLHYHAKLAIKGTPYYDLAVQADYDNRILLSLCPELDPRNKH